MTKDQQAEITRISALISQAGADLKVIRDTLQESFDELSETVQEGAKGQALQDEIAQLDEAIAIASAAALATAKGWKQL